MISMIVAMAQNNAIGKDNDLLWHLPDDFKRFKEMTMGKPILMGRKTYESIGKPLPGRQNIVITRDDNFHLRLQHVCRRCSRWSQHAMANGVIIVHSIEAALKASEQYDEVMVIGGASFYQQMLPQAERLYMTIVHERFEADAFFPDINLDEWDVIEQSEHAVDGRHSHAFSFITYQKKS
ncbi:MAG: dihydrofolate reductase [Cycloclasticus sp. symbiont of Poecilosclerida sp. N]|nr:MAG: dihydrofolate reductase [Cycloclasticus sp. symbiont of Poecilosclerida sp. N]